MVRKKILVLGWLEQPRQGKNILYRHGKPNKPTNEEPLSFVLFESPFTSVSTVSMGQPLSIVSLSKTSSYILLSPNGLKLYRVTFVDRMTEKGLLLTAWTCVNANYIFLTRTNFSGLLIFFLHFMISILLLSISFLPPIAPSSTT